MNFVSSRTYGYVMLIYLVFSFTACDKNKPSTVSEKTFFDGSESAMAPKKASFENLFQYEEQITMIGDSLTPTFSFSNPLVTQNKIYVCDYMGHYVAIYDKQGQLITKFGKKGKGPGEFQMPYGVALDAKDNLYINDRGNMRVQVYNSTLKLLKIITTNGQNETILVRNTQEKPNIVAVGVAICRYGQCLLQEYDWEGKLVNDFSYYKERFISSSWAVTQDVQGNIYLVNVFDQEIMNIFDATGKTSKTLKLSSPSMSFLKKDLNRHPKSMAELQANVQALNEEEHTEVRAISVKNNLIFIQLKLVPKDTFILDIYNLNGTLMFYGIETPGYMINGTDKFYFLHNDDTLGQYGMMKIKGYRFLPETKNE